MEKHNKHAPESRRLSQLTLAILLFGPPSFACLAFILFIIPRWPQVGYWPYMYPKKGPYLMDILIPAIAITAVLIFFVYYRSFRKIRKGRTAKAVRAFIIIFNILLASTGGGLLVYGMSEWQFYLYDAGPYLTLSPGRLPNESVTVCWHTAYFTPTEIFFGDRIPPTERISGEGFGQFHKITLEGLEPNKTYYYSIPNHFGGKIFSFTTAPNGIFNFTVLFWSDPRTNNPYDTAVKGANVPKYMAEYIADNKIRYVFSICGGDITSRGVDYRTWMLWLKDISTKDFASNYTHIVSFGNHERFDDIGGRNIPLYYPIDYGGKPDFKDTSYSFVYGNAFFIILDRWNNTDPWWGGENSDGAYADWIAERLSSASARNADFRILVMHPNPVIHDEHCGDNRRIMKIASEYGIDLILCGHYHTYYATDFNGEVLNYNGTPETVTNLTLMVGIGGNSIDPQNAGYCILNFTDNTLRIRTVKITGEILGDFIIKK